MLWPPGVKRILDFFFGVLIKFCITYYKIEIVCRFYKIRKALASDQ